MAKFIKTDLQDNIGICIKDLDSMVRSQNSLCKKICGNQIGKKCAKGCMLVFQKTSENQLFDFGFHHLRNVETDGTALEAVMINDGEYLTTMIIKSEENLQRKLQLLAPYNLSKAELRIMTRFMRGMKSKEIAAELFISKTTLRTHLNNIYKKIPVQFKNEIVDSHMRRERPRK